MALEGQEKPKEEGSTSAADLIKGQQGTDTGGQDKTETDKVETSNSGLGDGNSDITASKFLDEQRQIIQSGDKTATEEQVADAGDTTKRDPADPNKGEIDFAVGPPKKGTPLDTSKVAQLDTEETEGEKTEGEKTEGEKTEGEKTEGEKTEGEKTEGEKTEGEKTEGEKTEGDKTEGEKTEGATDKPAETLLEIINDAKNVQEKVNLITHHMDNAGERLREVNVGNPDQKTKDERLVKAMESFENAAKVVTADDIEVIKKQREVLQREILKEQDKTDKDVEKLRALKIMERNLYVLERAPGFTRGNAALSLYSAGKPEAGRVLMSEAFKVDPLLRTGKDPNFWNRAAEIDAQHNKETGKVAPYLQQDIAEVMLELKDFKPPTSRIGETEGEKTEGEKTEGEKTEGEKTEGEKTEGEKTEGEKTEGEKTEGENTEGENTEGEKTEGEKTEGANLEGGVTKPVVRADLTGGATTGDGGEEVREKSEPPKTDKTEHIIELPEVAASPLVNDKSPYERVSQAFRTYLESRQGVKKADGSWEVPPKSPKESLSEDLIAEFEGAIRDSDKGITPRREAYEKLVREKQLAVDDIYTTKLSDIEWNPNAETDEAKKELPEPLKGRGNETLHEARENLAGRFTNLIQKDLNITPDKQQIVSDHITRLFQSTNREQFVANSRALDQAFNEDPVLKNVLENNDFKAMRNELIWTTDPIVRKTGELDIAVSKYKGEFNQRSASRGLYGQVLKELALDETIPEEERGKYLQAARRLMTESYALNVVESSTEQIGLEAFKTGVKPTDLITAALDQNKKVESGEADMGVTLPMIAGDVTNLYKLEAGYLSDHPTNYTQEGFQKAYQNFKESGVLDRLIAESDAAKEPQGNEKYLSRMKVADIMYAGGDKTGALDMAKQAYLNTSDAQEAQTAFSFMISGGADPAETFKFALDTHKGAVDKPVGMPMHQLARNSVTLFGKLTEKNLPEGKAVEDLTEQELKDARAKAMETMKPLMQQMVEQSDANKFDVKDERYVSRRFFGELLARVEDPDAKQVLTEAYSHAPNLTEANLTSQTAVAVGAKPKDLLTGLINTYENSTDRSNLMNSDSLLLESQRMMQATFEMAIDPETGKVVLDGQEVNATTMWKQIHEDYKPQFESLGKIFDADVAKAKEVDDLLPQDPEKRAQFMELHGKVFYSEPEAGKEFIDRNSAIYNITHLLKGGETEQQGRAHFEKIAPEWLKAYDDWAKMVAPDGNPEKIKQMLELEQQERVSPDNYKFALTRQLHYGKLEANMLRLAGEVEPAKEVLVKALEKVPEQYKEELIEKNEEVARIREVLTGERAKPDFTKLNSVELRDHIDSLSAKPNMIVYVDPNTGQTAQVMVAEGQDISTFKVNGVPLSQMDRSKYVISYQGQFDADKTNKNLAEYKLAFQEYLKRADNPTDTDGNSLSFEQLKQMVNLRSRALDQGVDLTAQPTEGANGEKVYPELTATRRVELHREIVSGLKTMTDPVYARMEYAQRLEQLGQREDASKAYQEAFTFLKNVPKDLIEAENIRLTAEKTRLGNQPVNPHGEEFSAASGKLAELQALIVGNENIGTEVLDISNGTDGGSIFKDPRKFGIPSLSYAYGLDGVHTVLAKRAAFFYLAPKFEQAQAHFGTPQVYGPDGTPVDEDRVPKERRIPYGSWTYGNSDSFKPEAAKAAMAQMIADTEGISLDKAKERIGKDQEYVVQALEFLRDQGSLKNNLPNTMQDREMNQLYTAMLANVEPRLTKDLRDDFGSNLMSDAGAGLMFVGTMALLSRGKWFKAGAGATTKEVLAKAALKLGVASGAAYATRYGSMYYLTDGNPGSHFENMMHTAGSIGVAYIGTKTIAGKWGDDTMRLIPEENMAALGQSLARVPGGKFVVDSAAKINTTLKTAHEVVQNVNHNLSQKIKATFGISDDVVTIGQVQSLMAGEPTIAQHFKKAVQLNADDLATPIATPRGQELLKQAGLKGGPRFGLSADAAKALPENATIDDIARALGKDPRTLNKLVDLTADDLLRPITDDLGVQIFERAGVYGSGYRGVAKTLFEQGEKAKIINAEKLADELMPHMESRQVAETLAKHLKPYGAGKTTVRELKDYLAGLGTRGREMAARIPDDVAILGTNLTDDVGQGVIRELGLTGKNLGQLAREAQSSVVLRTTEGLSENLAKGLGKPAAETTIDDLVKALNSVPGGRTMANRLSRAAKNLDDGLATKLNTANARSAIEQAGIQKTPGILNDPVAVLDDYAKAMGGQAENLNLQNLYDELVKAGRQDLATKLKSTATRTHKGTALDDISMKSDEAVDIVTNAKLHHSPGALSGKVDMTEVTAGLSDDLLKNFGDDYAGASIDDFKALYRRRYPDMNDARFNELFDEHFPNLKNIPGTTAFRQAYRFNLKAFEGGEGIQNILGEMPKDLARAIQNAKPGLLSRASTLWNSSGKTAFNTTDDAAAGAGTTEVVSEGGAATTASSVPSLADNGASVLNWGYGRLVDGVKMARPLTDRIKPGMLNTTSDFAAVFRAGDAEAVHAVLAMKGVYNSTAIANELMKQENPETPGQNYTYLDAVKFANTPDLIGDSLAGTAWKTFIAGSELAFTAAVVRSGGIPRHTYGPKAAPIEGFMGIRSRPLAAIPRTWSRLKDYASAAPVAGEGVVRGVTRDVTRAAVTGGAFLTFNPVYDGAITGIMNTSLRGPRLDNFSNEIGPSAHEKLEYLRTPISNSPYETPPNWLEQKAKDVKDAVIGTSDEGETKVNQAGAGSETEHKEEAPVNTGDEKKEEPVDTGEKKEEPVDNSGSGDEREKAGQSAADLLRQQQQKKEEEDE